MPVAALTDYMPAEPTAEALPLCPDYERVRTAIDFLSGYCASNDGQPSLGEVASEIGLSPAHFQRLFKRWAGLSPKEFTQALRLDHARKLLRGSASVLDASFEAGLSGPARLHDLFVTHEAMTPGDYRARGRGLTITYGVHASPFGLAMIMATARGVCGIGFADDAGGVDGLFEDLRSRWPEADYQFAPERTAPYAARIFANPETAASTPLRVVLIGSTFDRSVWEALLKIPLGRAVTYADIATYLGRPKAARAVGGAVGRNPLSFVIPCHRVLRKGGALGGYHWGLTRKMAMIGWERGRASESSF